jgi:mono/diheme cytochrome c family protein
MSKSVFAAAALALALTLGAVPSLAAKNDERLMNDQEVEGLFASTCGFCHAEGGRVAGKGPQLMGTKRSDAFIINRIKQGKEARMPAFGQALTDAQIKSIVHYIRHLKPD